MGIKKNLALFGTRYYSRKCTRLCECASPRARGKVASWPIPHSHKTHTCIHCTDGIYIIYIHSMHIHHKTLTLSTAHPRTGVGVLSICRPGCHIINHPSSAARLFPCHTPGNTRKDYGFERFNVPTCCCPRSVIWR